MVRYCWIILKIGSSKQRSLSVEPLWDLTLNAVSGKVDISLGAKIHQVAHWINIGGILWAGPFSEVEASSICLVEFAEVFREETEEFWFEVED